MEINNVIIENRPLLQCANFFITFTNNFASVEAVKLNVTSERLTIHINDREYFLKFNNYFKLHTQTLSQLTIKKNYINFRINTNEGSFSSELLNLNELNSLNNNFTLNVNLKIHIPYSTRCSNCTNFVSESVEYSRILELPSENMDMSDWFCHKHHTHKDDAVENGTSNGFIDENSTEKQNSSKFKPSNTDIFYGNHFALFHISLLKNVRYKGKLIYCKRCLQFLGEITNLKAKDCVKFWNDTVNFTTAGENVEPIYLFPNESILKNFIFILRKLQNDFKLELFGIPQMFKVIFETTLSNGKQNFLLIQIMDHNLTMLRMAKREALTDLITLESCKTIKLLFKFEEDEDQPLVNFWLSNTNISNIQISPQMFTIAVNHLVQMSKLIPECYRTSYGFLLSYIDT